MGSVVTEPMLLIFKFVFVAIVFLLMLKFVDDATNNTLLEKNYYARDFSLMLDTLYAAPGNVHYSYPADQFEQKHFLFEVNNSRVNVNDR